MLKTPHVLASLVVGLLTACYATLAVPYTPNPARIADPHQEAIRIIKANVSPGCVAEPEFDGNVLSVKFVCTEGVGNTVARLDQVQSIAVQKGGDWYRVLVHHDSGIADFSWTSKSLDDIQHLDDALTALSHSAQAAAK